MAEQEACTDLVTKASQEQSSGTIEGESLLLPLLQGLLDAPEPDQTPDSGTESAGEDQRSGLIAEVQNALDKLSASLRSDATDVTAERRASLLQLVTKLQAGLAGSSKSFERRSSSAASSRFSRRRHRPSRHTVGVSSEELADARKLMEVISHEITPSHSNSAIALQKQNSESAVSGSEEHSKMPKFHVKNSTAKPFNSSFSRSTSNASSVPTPEVLEGTFVFDPKPQDLILNPVVTEVEPKKVIQPDLILQSNPVYQEAPKPQSFEDKSNRFNSKKLRMKRANTIDIPKPLNFYEDDDTDDDFNDQKRRDYLTLRGPIRVNTPDSKNWTPPLLQPKTDNDKKFMAFISKHNEKNNQGTVWNSPNNKASVWGSKFGNIKTNFEKVAPLADQSNGGGVRNFWKSADDSVRFGNGPKRNSGPKISKESAHNLQKMFEEKKRQSFEDNNWANDGIVTGSLKVANAYEQPKPIPHRFVPQPLPVNKFSHAPSSAFQPLPLKKLPDAVPLLKTELAPPKTPTSREEAPLFLYSPKPYHKDLSISPTSPMGNSKPWANISGGEKRVLNLAASKFEQPLQNAPVKPSVTPRRLSKEQIFLPSTLPAQSNISTPPYLGKSIDGKNGSSVRKLSGQYDNLGFNTQNVCTENRFQPKFTVPQNYSIKYDQPIKPETPKIDNSTPKFTVPQNYSVTYDKPKVKPELPQRFSQSFDQPDPKLDENYLAYKARHASPTYQAQTQVKTTIFAVPQEPNTKIASKPIVKVSETPKYETQVSNESVHEHIAVSSRVMTGPVAQTADTVRQKSPMTRGEHDFEAALGLRNALTKIGNVQGSKTSSPNPVTSPNNKSLKMNISTNNVAYGKPKELLEVTDLGESIVTSKFQIPFLNIAPATPDILPCAPQVKKPSHAQVLSKSDSWHQICLTQTPNKPSPRSSPNARNVMKSKSVHNLALPKLYEAGMSKEEMQSKKRTMENFFGGPKAATGSPNVKRAINRVKTSEKASAVSHHHSSYGMAPMALSRSRTLPDIVTADLLDESNPDMAFEQLFKSS